MQSVMPQFLASSFEMLRESQAKMMENLAGIATPMAGMPGFDALRKQQETFMKTMMGGVGGMPGWSGSGPAPEPEAKEKDKPEDLAEIKRQLAELQQKLSKL
jgi:polyhydroxyalkanoate synthesis regulator protein